MKFTYRCSVCRTPFDIVPELTLCPDCSRDQQCDQPLKGVLEIELHGSADPGFNIFELLPVEPEYFPPIPVGNTPLWQPSRLRNDLKFPHLFIKDDGSNPTFSLKDRASYLVSAAAAKFGVQEIALASTGNAGSSMAGVGAAAGQKITLFLPKTAPQAKLIQALQYGAAVHRINGNYDNAYDMSLAYTAIKGGMNRNTAYNPMTIEGKKTVSLEIYQQLGKAPDIVFVSVGDGCILSGLYKGFRDLKKLGIIPKIPKIIGVQARTSDALYRAFNTGVFENIPTATIADSICVDIPKNGFHALNQLKQFNGLIIRVSDTRILRAQTTLSSTVGLFTEPAGAAAFAGFQKLAPELDPMATVVILTTGNGLKDTQSATKNVNMPDNEINSIDDILK